MMRHSHFLLCFALLCALLLCACGAANTEAAPGTASGTQQADGSSPASTGDTPEAGASETAPTAVPYTFPLDAATQIFGGPGYDYVYVQAVGQDGVYTIEEESGDGEGNLWGRLKSGVGWVDLTYARSEDAQNAPVTACFGDGALLRGGQYREYIAEESAYAVKLVFRAREPLRQVRFTSLQPKGDSYETAETLYTLDALTPEMPFVAQVVYYGDMTAYGLSFTDSASAERCYAAYISGRNGALVLDEYSPAP